MNDLLQKNLSIARVFIAKFDGRAVVSQSLRLTDLRCVKWPKESSSLGSDRLQGSGTCVCARAVATAMHRYECTLQCPTHALFAGPTDAENVCRVNVGKAEREGGTGGCCALTLPRF